MLGRIEETTAHLREFVAAHFGVDLKQIAVETPPRTELGDLAFPFPFELAKTLRRPPRQIAAEIEAKIDLPPQIERLVAAGGGYVNVFFKRAPFFEDLYRWLHTPSLRPEGEKIIVEHTNINPNKAAHIGHLRNAALGDTLVRLLTHLGRRVEVQNYIDNTGVQVADVVVGFLHLRGLSLPQIREIPDPFDYYCWDLYAEVSAWYQEGESRTSHREKVLQDLEAGREPASRIAEHVSTRIVLAHLRTMLRIGVRYQLLPRESEILSLRFWEDAFKRLKETEAIVHREDGPYRGCWTMTLPGTDGQPGEEKIIVRSNGTVTYVGKDIAYQLWKFGLLGKSFHYKPFCAYDRWKVVPCSDGTPDDNTVWMTTVSSDPAVPGQPEFGRAAGVYNVIDVRQSYLQRVVTEGLKRLGHIEEADRSIHFSYEMVALSPACCVELGIELSGEDRKRPYVEVSGRRGLGVKADDLIDKLVERSLDEVSKRAVDLEPAEKEEIARTIAVGALRYFLVKYARTSVIAFDFAEALSFEGETGPYLQYSVVRANSIFHKFEGDGPEFRSGLGEGRRAEVWADYLGDDEIWSLLMQIARTDEVIDQAVRTLELSHLAKHTFNLAQAFNHFYHTHHILSEEDSSIQYFYLTVADSARTRLVRSLDLLGIPIPERM